MESSQPSEPDEKTKLYEARSPCFDDPKINDNYINCECETCVLLWSDICRARDCGAVIIEKHLIRLLEQHLKNTNGT